MTPAPDIPGSRRQLEARLADLRQRSARIEADLSEPLPADFAEQATEAEDDEALETQDAVLRREVEAVEAALRRIDDGHYGLCAVCGDPIAEARLLARPEAVTCLGCASQQEHGGRI
jgi:DnaK suppressor protein